MFDLPDLPYGEAALAPLMSQETLHTHHKKHHAGYVKKLNKALASKGWRIVRLEDVIVRAKDEADDFLFDQSAQVWNHTFFWRCMTPAYEPPDGELVEAIEQTFGGVERFREMFLDKGEKHFGSGYLWLVADRKGRLDLLEGHDASTPISERDRTPVLGVDLWEHAYYLDHKNERGAYLKGFFDKLVDWSFAHEQLAAARGQGQMWRHPTAQTKADA